MIDDIACQVFSQSVQKFDSEAGPVFPVLFALVHRCERNAASRTSQPAM